MKIRKNVEARRRSRRFAPGVLGLCLVMILASSLTLVAAPAAASPVRGGYNQSSGPSAAGNNSTGPLIIPGTYVTFTCTHGTISLDGTQYCSHTTTASRDLCDSSSCQFSMTGTVDSGYTFYGWQLSGQASVSCGSCLSTTLTVYTPNSADTYSASVTLDTTSSPPPPPTCNGAPTISSATSSVQSGYRQAWVNWTYSIPSSGLGWYPGFRWYQGSTQLRIPSFSSTTTSASINLNALAAGTTYSYTAAVSNCDGSATKSGTFMTSNAPANEFVGWVSQLSSNSYLLDQVGSTLSGSTVWLSAYCEYEYADVQVGSNFYPSVALEQVSFSSVTTSPSGAYSLGFPETDSYTITPTGGVINFPVTVWLALNQNGQCQTSDSNGASDYWMGQQTQFNNQNYLLEADHTGYWNATEWVSSQLNPNNGYQQFGLQPNIVSFAAAGVAFIHTSYADCGVTIADGFQQTVNAYVAGSGNSFSNGWGTLESDDQGYGAESSVAFHYDASGILNETSGKAPVLTNTYAVSGPFGPELGGVQFTDPNSSPPYTDASHIITVGPFGSVHQFGLENGGSYTSTAGLDMSVGFSVGWGGFSAGPTVDLVYTTTTTTSSQKEILCSFTDPSTTENVQFYFYADGTQAGNKEAVNLHIWYDDLCISGGPGC